MGPRDADPGHLGPEQAVATPGSDVPIGSGLTQQLRRITSIPADDDVVDGALRLVVALARATVAGADGVSVSLRRHGHLSTVAASDETILEMDADQYSTGEGPCLAASVEGRWFHVASLDHETRWPAFIPKAQALGINAILSSPLLANDRPLGALNIYSRRPDAFAAREQELASLFAAEAGMILAGAGVDVTEGELAARVAEALRTRQVIFQAQGIIMAREHKSEADAYTVLRAFSRRTGRPLGEHAADVVASTRLAPVPDGGVEGMSHPNG